MRFGSRYLFDAASWTIALALAFWFHYEVDVPATALVPAVWLIVVTVLQQVSHTRADPITPERLDQAGWMARMFAQPRANETGIVEPLRKKPEAHV